MEAIFSEEEIIALQNKTWWVACNENPFLVKSAIYTSTILIMITDLRKMWVTRVDKKELLEQKQIFAKTLEVRDFNELLTLFEGILANPDKKALYQFVKKKNNCLGFKVEKQISVYPFSWKFDLLQVEYDIVAMLCKQILNPMTRALNAQEKRSNIMKKKMENMEKQLLKKMTQIEKNYYKSALVEDEQDLKLLITQPKQTQFISDLRLQSTSKFFFQKSYQFAKPTKSSIMGKYKEKEKFQKVEKRVVGYIEQSGEEQYNEYEMRRKQELEKKKAKKNRDFI